MATKAKKPKEKYKPNTFVVHPHHGAAKVIRKVNKNVEIFVEGEPKSKRIQYFEIEVLMDGLTVMVPVDAVDEVIRPVISKSAVSRKVFPIFKEKPEEAVWREMMEEIGTNNAKLIKSTNQWYKYEIPKETLKTLPWGEKYIGQKQKWFAFRFTGKEEDINVNTNNPEFSEWKWILHNSLVDNIVPFKRKLYKNVLSEFENLF